MQPDDIGFHYRARASAQGFAQTATLLYENYLADSPRRQPNLLTPFIVNASFACELFLKALCQRAGASFEGHQLEKLLAALPVNDRQRIEHAWVAAAGTANCSAAATLEAVVGEMSNSFVEWRYAHEKERVTTASSASILALLRVLDEASQ